MSKTKIAIIAAVAVLLIGGAAAAVPVAKKMTAKNVDDESSAPISVSYDEETSYEDAYEDYTEDVTEESTEASSDLLTTAEQISTTIKEAATSKASGNNVTKKAVTTQKVATTAAKKTTTTKKSSTTTKKSTGTTSDQGLVKNAIGEYGSAFLGYRWSDDGYYYCDDKDCWQKGAGYNEIYDKWAAVACMFIDQIHLRFTYGGKDWMVECWKGQYGWLLVGAEIGLYTAEEDSYTGASGDINHYDCADEEDWLYMQLDCYWAQNNDGHYKKVFTRPYDKYWWATGFVKGQLTKYSAPRTELKTKNRITFKDEAMANTFVTTLKNSGFVRAAAADQLLDDSYYQSGKDVWFLWSTKYHGNFTTFSKTLVQ